MITRIQDERRAEVMRSSREHHAEIASTRSGSDAEDFGTRHHDAPADGSAR